MGCGVSMVDLMDGNSLCTQELGRWYDSNVRGLQKEIRAKHDELRVASSNIFPGAWVGISQVEGDHDALREREELYWHQRSRDMWLSNGDKNIKYFHWRASARRARNHIRGLFDNSNDIRSVVFDMYPTIAPGPYGLLALFLSMILTESSRDIAGFRCSKGGLKITHLFLTDDSLLFTRASERDFRAIRSAALDSYASALGQVVNFDKFVLCVSSKVSHSRVETLAQYISVRLVECHKRYLGRPSFAGKNKRMLFASSRDLVWDRVREEWWRLWFFSLVEFPLGQGTVGGWIQVAHWAGRLSVDLSLSLGPKTGYIQSGVAACVGIPCSSSQLPYSITWHYDKFKAFSVKSGYHIGCNLLSIPGPSDFYRANAVAMTCPSSSGLVGALWRPPDPGLYKVNTDAALDVASRKIGIGLIIHNCFGKVMASSAQSVLAVYSPLVTEELVIFRGLRFAREVGLAPCFIESKAQVVANLFNSDNVPFADVGLILKDCKLLLEASLGCCVGFAPTLANKATHGFAKLGLSLYSDCFWIEECPSNVASIVLGDCPNQ
ncbi:hypothetical protein Dsin_018497 [Dipteronia sinensis]|uniref:RNase H type-1 domain-containing protein n=1 Tax=Dipteronia sinensis TaxID=43782 RepID=A0AAE0A6Y3_9ROSI|nr:hypothetical protein Dsin_018497 [Dipteronia sinensis]